MTDGPAAWQTPQDPAELAAHLNYFAELPPETRELLLGEGANQIPVEAAAGYSIQFSHWVERIEGGDTDGGLLEEIAATIAAGEAEHPDGFLWDTMRADCAQSLAEASRVEDAFDFINAIHSRHYAAKALMEAALAGGLRMDSADVTPAQAANRIMAVILAAYEQRLDANSDPTRVLNFLQALVDNGIDRDPDHPIIDVCEQKMLDRDPDRNLVQSWADSQRELHPSAEWEKIVAFIAHDPAWRDVPRRWRQHLAKEQMYWDFSLSEELSTEGVLAVAKRLQDLQNQYPLATAWDTYLAGYVAKLLRSDDALFALDFARAIRFPGYLLGAAKSFDEAGYTPLGAGLRAQAIERIQEADRRWEAK